ncbi:MAG: hypothetical protein Q7J47_21550, partial [Azoarcus sp.]|nr:hypothetical protein [Azoarcus sp.]
LECGQGEGAEDGHPVAALTRVATCRTAAAQQHTRKFSQSARAACLRTARIASAKGTGSQFEQTAEASGTGPVGLRAGAASAKQSAKNTLKATNAAKTTRTERVFKSAAAAVAHSLLQQLPNNISNTHFRYLL